MISRNFRTLVERNADAILVVDRKGFVCLANPAAEELFGRCAAELVGGRFGHPMVPGTKAEIDVVRQGGAVATAEIRLVDIEWEGERAYLASLRDVTERKRTEQALDAVRREQLEMRDQLLSHVSHELRTPLTAIHEFLSLALDGVGGVIDPEVREYLDIAFQNARQLTSLIDDLCDASRADSGKLRVECRPLDAGQLVRDCVHALQAAANENGVTLAFRTDLDLVLVQGDDTRVRQILSNLIENAIKFTPEGGSITVVLERDPDERGHLRFSVIDTGCGIRRETLRAVFDRLQQDESSIDQSRKGLGLGLFICRELVRRQGGRIWVESELGSGATFRFTLPEFSLELLVTPALVKGRALRETYGTVCVDLVPKDGHEIPTPVDEHVRRLLEGSIFPEIDVLLPRLGRSQGRFWLLVGADDVGVKSLVGRLQKRLAAHHEIERNEIDVRVEGSVHRLSDSERRGALGDLLPSLAQRIAILIRACPGAGRGDHEKARRLPPAMRSSA